MSDNSTIHECENIKLLTDMQIKIAEMSRDMVHFAACFQELNAQLSEFMEKQEQRVADIQNTCVMRSIKWNELEREALTIRADQRDLYKRLEIIERVHSEEFGGKQATRPYKDYIVYVFMTITSILLTYLFFTGGIHAD
jgi:hypothetical protein